MRCVQVALECLYELERPPDAFWAYRAVLRGLRSDDAETREMALSVASQGSGGCWVAMLFAHSQRETETHLQRYTRFILDNRRAVL